MLTGTHNIMITSCWLGLTSLIIIYFRNIFYVDWDSQTEKFYHISYILSSLLYLDLDSHHCSLYFLKIYSMLTGIHNLIITLCSMGLTSLSWYSLKIQSMLTGTHNSSSLHVDLDSHLWSWYLKKIYSMLTGTHNIIITLCWLAFTSLIMIFQKNHSLCWLGLTTYH